MDGFGVHRRQEADKGWQPEETQPIHSAHMGERDLGRIPAEMVKKSFLKTGISNSMDVTEYDHLWQDLGESLSSEEEPEETWDTDEQQEWGDLFGESDDEDFEGFV